VVSPFIQPSSRQWGAYLTIKSALVAAVFLLASFICSFFFQAGPLSHLLLAIVYFLAGVPSLIEAIEELCNGEINIDILMTLAAFSSVLIGSGMEGGLLLVLFALSGAMEDAVTSKAKGTLSSLHKLSPTKASLIEADGTVLEKSIHEIAAGAHLLIKAGQIIPLDGEVVQGISSVNLVHLTGENLPVTKKKGDAVPAGGLNMEGTLTLRVTHTSSDSTLAQIIQLVTEAQEARPTLQRWFDRLSRSYALTIILASFLFALSFPLLFNIPFLGPEGSVYRALAFLIAASPCALIIAIPIAYLGAISACASKGILLKGGISLDALASCKAIAFDKTGTLTTGELRCIGIEPLLPGDQEKQEAAAIAYALEKNAHHPIAAAITRYGKEQKLAPLAIDAFRALPGYGLEAKVHIKGQESPVYIGKPSFIQSKLPEAQQAALEAKIKQIEEAGDLLAVLFIGSVPSQGASGVYIFRFQDTPRQQVKQVIKELKKRGLEAVMLTGDRAASAKKIADSLDIQRWHADLTPEEKLAHVAKLAPEGLAMVGDGVNDAPALARATVGICMGRIGSGAAVDAADIILLHDTIQLLDWLIGKAKQTVRIVRQNLTLAAAAILIASIPALAGLVPLWLAVVMHEGGTILVGLNALRLLRE
jgi:heavy metal translocating P-type ATPase